MLEIAKACMPMLHAIASIRTEFLNSIMLEFTYLGDKSIFFVIGFIFYWSFNKYAGYVSLLSGTSGLCINVALKDIFRIPRPFILDNTFHIVESSKNEVIGYSFPSGHATNITASFGTLFLFTKNKIVKILSVIIIIIVCFSRMYVGAHTLLDVSVGFLITVFVLLWYYNMIKDGEKKGINKAIIVSLLLFLSHVICVIIINVLIAGGKIIVEINEQKSMIRMAVLLAALLLPTVIAIILDQKYINYDTSGSILFQIIKIVIGLAIVFTYKKFSKQLFAFIPGYAGEFFQNFVMMLLGLILCPIIFQKLKKIKIFNK